MLLTPSLPMIRLLLAICALICTQSTSATNAAAATPLFRHQLGRIHAEELFTSAVQPALFNWTFGQPDQFTYRVALAGRPDLPTWMRYMYSSEYGSGYLYGTPPSRLIGQQVHIDVVALDALTYESRHVVITYTVVGRAGGLATTATATEKSPLRTVQKVEMRVDNLNWVQLMDPGRVENLKNIFRHDLWPESSDDLYVAFMDSAVTMGGRVPLRPQEKEGVVIHLASTAPLSVRLLELQQEIRPLYKLSTCPYKRSSVQTVFETAGFKVDWCAFHIRDGSVTATDTDANAHHHASSSVFHRSADGHEPTPMQRADVPQRNYIDEMALAMCVPLLVFTLLVAVLTMIVCLHQGKIEYPTGLATHAVQMVQYAGTNNNTVTSAAATSTPAMRPGGLLEPDAASLRSSSRSPCASLTRQPQLPADSPQLRLASNSTLRPRPPPYKPPGSGGHQQQLLTTVEAVVQPLPAAAAAMMSQSASSRVLYC